jgi:hypothetical protein
MERIPFMSLDTNKIKAFHSSYSITAENFFLFVLIDHAGTCIGGILMFSLIGEAMIHAQGQSVFDSGYNHKNNYGFHLR